MLEKTLVIIKPDMGLSNQIGKIITRYEEKGLKVIALKMIHLDEELASRFYEVHKEKEFFAPLVEYMRMAPVVAMLLEKEDAIHTVRELNGKTDPSLAAKGTIRHDFGETIRRNAVHSSDCPKSFLREINILFPEYKGIFY